ncbi:MAG: hypothetical protein HXK99_01620 [Candidatus Nanosynbacter sp.]|nr:hypothetical protein [Candidatus Nanosynbacter sp.]
METNGLFKVESYSVRARIIAYVLLFVPVGYLAVAVSFIAIAMRQFDHRFIAMSQSEVRIPFWILSVFSAAFCVYAAKVTWSFFTEFRDLKTDYVFRRALKKEIKLDNTPNFDDYFRPLGEEPKPRKSILRKVDYLLPW